MSKGFRIVTRARPCPACGKPDWCAWMPDGAIKCERSVNAPNGMRLVTLKDGGAIFAPIGARQTHQPNAYRPRPGGSGVGGTNTSARGPGLDWHALADRFAATLTAERRAALAAELGVSDSALTAVGIGWASRDDLRTMRSGGAGWQENYPEGAYTFPERDSGGRIVGLGLRASDGRKGFPSSTVGAHRGLIVPTTLKDAPDPVLLVEGMSDVAAGVTMGLAVVGRPSNSGGAEHLARLLKGRDVLVVGERDQKDNGSWPGRDGAESTASRIASEWSEPIAWALPPEAVKDIRAFLGERIAAGLDLGDAGTCKAAGADLLAALKAAAEAADPEKRPPQSEMLVRLAHELFRIGLAEGDEPFAVPHNGPNIALMFRGSRDALRAALSREYRRRGGTTANGAALGDALLALQGEAHECAPEAVYLRLAEHEGAIVLDLGRADGRVVIVRPGGWEVVDVSPVLFRRTALTGELPEPESGGSVDDLRGLFNVTPQTWPPVVGWLVAAMIPGIAHPVLMLGGEHGTGKTTCARFLVGLFDPSPAPVRSPPRDPEQWAIAAAGSWGVVIDNVSGIAEWWSDSLCKAVTGDGWLRRRLYTDGELSVLTFRRVIALTSIDAGALRGDLGDRLLIVDLERIPDERRLAESDLDRRYKELRPRVFGALLDLLAAVLRELPSVKLAGMPRMADFARILAAMDRVLETDALPLYLAQRGRIAGDVVEADPVGTAIVALIGDAGEWSGTSGELLDRITPKDKPPHAWPKTPRAFASRVRRLVPALRSLGVDVIPPAPGEKARRYVLRSIAPTAPPPASGSGGAGQWASGRAVDSNASPGGSPDRPAPTPPGAAADGDSGPSGGSGGPTQPPSGDGGEWGEVGP